MQHLSNGQRRMRRKGFDGDLNSTKISVTIDGRTKRWEELTPAEKAECGGSRKSPDALSSAHFDQAKAMRDLANVPDQARIATCSASWRKIARRSLKPFGEWMRRLLRLDHLDVNPIASRPPSASAFNRSKASILKPGSIPGGHRSREDCFGSRGAQESMNAPRRN